MVLPFCGSKLGDRSSSLPHRYQTHDLYTEALCRRGYCYRDAVCHALGIDGDVAHVWTREHAIDPEGLQIGWGEVGLCSECKVGGLGSCLGTITNYDSKMLVLLNFWLPPLFAL